MLDIVYLPMPQQLRMARPPEENFDPRHIPFLSYVGRRRCVRAYADICRKVLICGQQMRLSVFVREQRTPDQHSLNGMNVFEATATAAWDVSKASISPELEAGVEHLFYLFLINKQVNNGSINNET